MAVEDWKSRSKNLPALLQSIHPSSNLNRRDLATHTSALSSVYPFEGPSCSWIRHHVGSIGL